MDTLMRKTVRIWVALVMLCAVAAAQVTITPTNLNSTSPALLRNTSIVMQLQPTRGGSPDFPMIPLSAFTNASASLVLNNGYIGQATLIDDTSSMGFTGDEVLFISCDPYPGMLQAANLVEAAAQASAVAVVLYSQKYDYCDVPPNSWNYSPLFTMQNVANSTAALAYLVGHQMSTSVEIGSEDAILAYEKRREHATSTTSTDSAMIILYAITGIVASLFLAIIVTGAVRAHRHPERYGPRIVRGAIRQSRAKGLARAMLETLPIVKFGEREGEVPKAADIELGDATVESTNGADEVTETTVPKESPPAIQRPEQAPEAQDTTENGIAAATTTHLPVRDPNTSNTGHEECSICAEDFETGQDQRVLPCDHRFHPACIDPWLLNISGTCPLCRIDLRPAASTEEDVDEDGVAMSGMAPPLAPTASQGEQNRISIRRAIMLGIMGIARPDALSRDERVHALRQLRSQQIMLQRQEREAAVEQTAEEQNRDRRRLRNLLGRRTRASTISTPGEPPRSTGPENGV